jgi:DNA (cytosine-5)-methyltransferase 1
MNDHITAACSPHKNAKRTYFDGQILANNDFAIGTTYRREITREGVELVVDENGPLVVSSKSVRGANHAKPLVDICNREFADYAGEAEQVHIHAEQGRILITVHANEQRRAQRENDFIQAVNSGTLTEGTLCAGIGMSTAALHDGFASAGYDVETQWIADRERKYLDVAMRNNPAVTSATRVLNSPLEMIELDWYNSVNICQFSLPCTGHSKSGKTKNKIAIAEQHPTDAVGVYGYLKALDTINAAVYLSENVPEAKDSASYVLIKATLQALGYNIFETILNNEQSGSIENRERYWFVAVSKGLRLAAETAIPCYPRAHQRLGEIMEPIAADDKMWSENTYLKEKAKLDAKKGNGFTRQLVNEDTTQVGTINRYYNKRQSTPPMVSREDGMERLLTPVEHARAKQCNEALVADTPMTIAHEGLGQGIDMKQGEGMAKWIAMAVCNLVKAPRQTMTTQFEFLDLMLA